MSYAKGVMNQQSSIERSFLAGLSFQVELSFSEMMRITQRDDHAGDFIVTIIRGSDSKPESSLN